LKRRGDAAPAPQKARATLDLLGDLPYSPAQMRMTRALLDLVQGFEKRDPDFDQ
jgi:hypothetical protein